MDVYTNNFHKQDSSPLEFLLQAVTQAVLAHIFETLVERVCLTEAADGLGAEMKTGKIPAWFKEALLANSEQGVAASSGA